MSDTRAAAWLVHLYGVAYLDALIPSRWVHFGATRTTAHGEWRTRAGIRFSNLHWCGGDTGLPPHLQTRPSLDSVVGNAAPKGHKRERQILSLWSDHRDYWSRLMPKPA